MKSPTSRADRAAPPFAASEGTPWKAYLAIFALALALRLLYQREMADTLFFAVPVGDGAAFDAWGRRLAGGDYLGSEVYYQAPLYPHLLGVLYSLFGRDLDLVRVVQAALGALSCVFLAVAGRCFFDRRTGLVAGSLLALYAPAIFFDGLIKKVALATFLTTALLALLGTCLERPRRGRLLAAGLVLGALSLVRENARVLLLVLVPWLWFGFAARPARERLGGVVALVLGTLLWFVPVGLRNQAVSGELVFGTSNFGTNLYIGNNERADGFYRPLRPGRGHPEFERVDAQELAEAALGRSLSATEVSHYWRDRALAWAGSDPLGCLALFARKLYYLAHAREWMDVQSYDVLREQSVVLRELGAPMRFGLLLPAALVGMGLAWGARRRLALLYLSLAVLTVSIALFFVFARFRFSLVPMLVLFAAYACLDVVRCVGAGSFRRPALAVGAGGLLALGLAVPPDWAGALPAEELGAAATYNNLGTALARSGRPEDALASYRRAVEACPDYAAARFNLGWALCERGDTREALPHIERAIELEPGYYADAQVALGVAAARQGDYVTARARLEEARAADPGSAEVCANLGLALRQMGELEGAEAAYREALRIRPSFADVHNNLGFLLHGTGREAEATECYEQALRHDPGHVRALESLAWVRAASPDASLIDAGRALELSERGRRLVGGARWEDIHSMALATAGRFEEAARVAERAEALAREERQCELMREIAARRALYLLGEAFRYPAPDDH